MSNVIIPDISHYEKVENWSKVSANAPFLIMKATQRTNWVDPTLKEVVVGCRKKNIPYWLYSYIEKGSDEYHINQVKYLIEVTKNLGILGDADSASDKYFIGWVLDVENGNSLSGVSVALNYAINHSGPYKVMLYTGYGNYNKYKKLIDYIQTKPEKAAWWEARYGKNNPIYNVLFPPHKGCDLHQYTENGTYPGIKGKVDLNRLTGRKAASWFTTPYAPAEVLTPVKLKKTYSGEKVKKFPKRGFYKKGDGYLALTNTTWKNEIKKVQKIVSFITGNQLVIDGEYGLKTTDAVRFAQRIIGVEVDGAYGPKTNSFAMRYKK